MNEYHDAPPSGSPYPARIGDSLHFMQSADGLTQPQWRSTTTREQTPFTRQTLAWDNLARPLKVSSTGPSGSTADTYTYVDSADKWIVGAIASTTDSASGEEVSSARFDSLMRPIEEYAFGLLKARLTYDSDGTVSSATDATGRTTLFQQWHRGIPRRTQHPDGTARTAAIDDNGWIRSITDENGFDTGFDYDAMGRPSLLQPPAGDGQAWTPTVTTIQRMANSESGVAAGHWKQVASTGDGKRITYLDGLWRPVLEESFDAGDREGTLSQVFRRFDHENRLIFESYPGRYR